VSLVLPSDRQASMPTSLYVFGDRRAMRPYQRQVNGVTIESAGVFVRDNDAAYMFVNLEDYNASTSSIFHEYTHMLLSAGTARLPAWLDEGMAEYFSTFRLASGDRRALLGVPIGRHISLLRRTTMVPVAGLIAVDHQSPLYNESDRRNIFYAESWALVHYIFAEVQGGPASIGRYVNAIELGARPEDAFIEAFGATPAEVDRKLRDYVGRFVFEARVFNFKEDMKVTASPATRSVESAELEARLGDLQMRMNRMIEAAPRIEAAAAMNKTLAHPFVVLGQLRLRQARVPEALAALNRAVSLDPDDFTALFGFGEALMRYPTHAAAAGISEPSGVAVAALSSATKRNPFASDAFASLAWALQMEDRLPEARAAIDRAMALAPGRLDYQLRFADVLLNDGRVGEAMERLSAIVAASPGSAVASTAQVRLDQILERERRRTAPLTGPGNRLTADVRAEPPAPSKPPAPARVIYDLRPLREGEARAFGSLTNVECAPGRVRFHLTSNGRSIVASAARLQDVDVVSFRERPSDATLGCGERGPNDRVSLTWRPDTAASGSMGTALAIEFMPAEYVPDLR
jgi:tetratricopeptide (TPR) repeat protein